MKNASIFLIVVLVAFAGCKKRREKDIQPSKDFALMANNIQTIIPLVSTITLSDEQIRTAIFNGQDSLNTCAAITMISGDTLNVSNSSPLTFDIDFSTGCVDMDEKHKKGKIRCTLYGYMANTGANCSCTFVDFEIGGNKLNGSLSITNTGGLTLLVTTSDLNLRVGKKYIYIDTEIRVLQLDGDNTPLNLLDNSYSISSTSALTGRYGKEFDVFAEDLYKHYTCKWMAGGYAELNDDDNDVQVIDFGASNCDNEAEISIDEEVYTIELE